MARYIDADALLEVINHYILHDEDVRKKHSALFVEGVKDGYYRIKSMILNAPTEDVREVAHGEWVEYTGEFFKGDHYCSVCGEDACRNEGLYEYLTDFCPNCGADMRVNPIEGKLKEEAHAEWICLYAAGDTACSKCGFIIGEKGIYKNYNYCPNCGADMRGGNDGNSKCQL